MRALRRCAATAVGWVCCTTLLIAAQAKLRPSCPPDAGTRCRANGSGYDDYIFYVDENKLSISFKEGAYFVMTSTSNLTLDNPALPRFNSTVRVETVVFADFPVPERAYAGVLDALRVQPGASGTLTVRRAAGRLGARHLAALACAALQLDHLRLAPDAFDQAPRLLRLRLDAAMPVDLARLPASLTELELVATGVARLNSAALARFPNLTTLMLRDDDADVFVEPTAPLEKLAVQARAVRVSATLPSSLEQLTLHGWAEEAPAPWRACAGLRSLKVLRARARALAGGWLARCSALRSLVLRAAPLERVAPDALRGAALAHLSLTRTRLRALPLGLLDGARHLASLDLSENLLEELQGSLFADIIPYKNLTELDLSRNQLSGEAFEAVSALRSLRALRLSHNALGDACAGGAPGLRGASRLESLAALAELRLRATGASRVCADWRALPLTRLDLALNRVTELTYADLQFKSAVDVDLSGNNVTRLVYSRLDFERLQRAAGEYCARGPAGEAPALASRARVRLDGAALRCDCELAWAARALRACPAHVLLAPAPRCSNNTALAALQPDELLCDEARCVAPACRCQRRSRVAAPHDVMRVTCARAGLTRVPPLGRARARLAWELRLPHNRLAAPPPADLPPHLLELDLRHNEVGSASAAAALLAPARRVLLADNPLRCDCSEAARAALQPRRQLLADYEHAVCGAAPPADCAPPLPLLPLLGAALPLAAAAAALGACALRPALRARLKALLRRGPAAASDVPYDVFLSYSHRDQRVADALLARLERGGARRVCVHQRDWAPGGWIPAQIAASVRRSRATVALVSAHFVTSGWALAEFREAYCAAPRLVVVLLDEPARLPLDAELRRYLATNTYVRWGDPWFWQKLLAALPSPRGAPPPAQPLLQLSPDTLAAELQPDK